MGLWEKPFEACVTLSQMKRRRSDKLVYMTDAGCMCYIYVCVTSCLFNRRDHFNLPARPSVWSEHRVHLFLPAAFGHQGNRPTWIKTSTVELISRAGLQHHSESHTPIETHCLYPLPGWHMGLLYARVLLCSWDTAPWCMRCSLMLSRPFPYKWRHLQSSLGATKHLQEIV